MKKRTFDEMVSYFNRKVADMEIDRKYKMELLGMITAILQEHDSTIKPDQRWIPVTERLPEEKKDVLAVDDEGFFYIAQYSVYNSDRRGYWEETTEYLSIDAVAWQPLPEPWKDGKT